MIIKKGSKGETVKLIQRFLGIKDDGDFGNNTRDAVIAFQRKNGLDADGKVGSFTFNKMISMGLKMDTPPIKQDVTLKDEDVIKIIEANQFQLTFPPNRTNKTSTTYDPNKHLIVVAVRGFKLSMGASPDKNDRGVYDDCHFIYTPTGIISFAGNTDPSSFRKGTGYGSKKGMAMLNTGVWAFGRGTHNGRLAFRQTVPFTVTRDGNPPYEDTGYFGINWHNGNLTTTSSAGCQTNTPSAYDTLRPYIYNKLEALGNPKMNTDWGKDETTVVGAFPYILIDEVERRKGNLVV
jgi:peptidoglycan hydrolase-like protein with peptidoglycan-binding domain